MFMPKSLNLASPVRLSHKHTELSGPYNTRLVHPSYLVKEFRGLFDERRELPHCLREPIAIRNFLAIHMLTLPRFALYIKPSYKFHYRKDLAQAVVLKQVDPALDDKEPQIADIN
jgi:hypothetical protein